MNNIKLSNLESVGLVLIIIINHVILNFSKSIIANTGSASALNILFIGIIVLLFVQLLLFLFKHFSGQDILDVSQYLGGKILKVISSTLISCLNGNWDNQSNFAFPSFSRSYVEVMIAIIAFGLFSKSVN